MRRITIHREFFFFRLEFPSAVFPFESLLVFALVSSSLPACATKGARVDLRTRFLYARNADRHLLGVSA